MNPKSKKLRDLLFIKYIKENESDERDLNLGEEAIPFQRKLFQYTPIKGFRPGRIREKSDLEVRIELKPNQNPEKIMGMVRKHFNYSLKSNELESLKKYMDLRLEEDSIVLKKDYKKEPSPLETAYISKFIMGYSRGLTK